MTLQQHLQVRPKSSSSAMHMMLRPNEIIFQSDPSFLVCQGDEIGGGGVSGLILPGLFLFLAIGAFLYANVVFTPEIIENMEQMRMENRKAEVQKLMALVAAHSKKKKNDGDGDDSSSSLEELRFPLEEAFGMTVEEYIVDVQNPNALIPYASADRDLAELLKPMARSA
jgi:hypothetical protein